MQEHAEEINRLHRSLKESQQECRDLLETRMCSSVSSFFVANYYVSSYEFQDHEKTVYIQVDRVIFIPIGSDRDYRLKLGIQYKTISTNELVG